METVAMIQIFILGLTITINFFVVLFKDKSLKIISLRIVKKIIYVILKVMYLKSSSYF